MPNKISVVIPAKDCEETIDTAIISVLEQTYQNFEIIIVDNNCSDNTIEKARDLAKDKLKVFKCTEPGIVPALNTGLQNAASEYIARQDGDDCWYPKKLELQMQHFETNNNIDICGTQIRLVLPSGEVVDDKFRYPIHDKVIKSWLLTGRNPLAHPSVIFKKKILLRVGGYDDSYPIAEDHHMWLRCIQWFNFSNLSEILVDYTSTSNPNYDSKHPLLASEAQFKILQHKGLVEVC
jgi:glycosyltransferase involved in cell wall biosynthesis